ncbi:MAG: hypothetical protein IKL82_00095 [Clostridia bacterium]|nr:hypothetical protein [Clostridia bacterium]
MDLKIKMKDAGIVGAGGAGFPSYAKLADGADVLVINGAECEPLLYTDYILLKRELAMVVAGITLVLKHLNVEKALLCVKDHTAKKLNIKDGDRISEGVFYKILPDVYPMGDEISLIYQATGRVVKPGNLPISAGVIVYNVETCLNIASAVVKGEPVTKKWLTVGGDISNPRVVKVPVGTKVFDLFKALNVNVLETHVVIDGGPSMGKVINYENAVVTKTTKSLLVLPKNIPAIESKFIDGEKSIARAETACCQCTRCTDICPRHLLGYPIEPHKLVRTAKSAVKFSPDLVLPATLCCGCGICETLACCQGISPKAVINEYKLMLGKEKLRYVSKDDVSPSKEREYRMIPSLRWESVLGVKKFDKVCEYAGEINADSVEIMLRQHIGAPSVPVVKTGDRVSVGDVIATAQDGLSLPQHASISGVVTVYDNLKITIDR